MLKSQRWENIFLCSLFHKQVSLTSLLPFIILSFLNFAIWRRLNFLREVTRKVAMMMRMRMIMVTHKVAMPNNVQESKSSLSSSAILICTVSMFLVCHLPRCHLVCHLPPCYHLPSAQAPPLLLRGSHDLLHPALPGKKLAHHHLHHHHLHHCQAKNKGITPIWYLYAMASVQLLQVGN